MRSRGLTRLIEPLALCEILVLYQMIKWSGCTDEEYRLPSLKTKQVGAFEGPTMKHILRTVKEFA